MISLFSNLFGHIMSDKILFERKDHFWIENFVILNRSKIGIDFAFYKIDRNSTYMGLPKNGFNNWISFYVNHSFSNNLFLHIGFPHRYITKEIK